MMMMMLARVLHYIDETTDSHFNFSKRGRTRDHRAACLDVSLLNLTRTLDVCDYLPDPLLTSPSHAPFGRSMRHPRRER